MAQPHRRETAKSRSRRAVKVWFGMPAALLFAALAARAAEHVFADAGCVLAAGETGRVEAIIDGATLRLASGLTVRLAAIQPFAGADDTAAAAVLSELALGRTVELRYGRLRTDRYGRATAQLFTSGEPEGWLQAEMVRRGLALVAGLREDRACLGGLLDIEREARDSGAGLWPAHAPFDADAPALRDIGDGFALVEGRVVSLGRRELTVYLNFGEDWSRDFTVSFSAANARSFEVGGTSLDSLVGRRVRIRGWLTQRDGPWIRIDHPEQIEVLDERR